MQEPRTMNQEAAAEYLSVSLWRFRQLEKEGVIQRLAGGGVCYSKLHLDAWLQGGLSEETN